jgi:hypothetical protein
MVSTRLRAVTTISVRPISSFAALVSAACARAVDGVSVVVPTAITKAPAAGPSRLTPFHPYDECIVRSPEFIIVLVVHAGSTPN